MSIKEVIAEFDNIVKEVEISVHCTNCPRNIAVKEIKEKIIDLLQKIKEDTDNN